ncbi:type II secretion system protein GspL [Samsonia erythrinae]|uniref:Type II secretion system protein L n=1 Tax=Samsonia erythrinae TaxID=160434 RepID=A0A4R3VSW3_9GAMM|nr:type II secretion system protein GspL [Samsonia erythrinae]TCV07062.1 general secretion pathway protein L [Samsonia erythrinae]
MKIVEKWKQKAATVTLRREENLRHPCLIIRLPVEEQGEMEWQARSPDGAHLLGQGRGSAESVRQALMAYPSVAFTRVLVPTAEVTFYSLTLPRQARRQLAQVVPFMLEEQLATEIETLHVAALEIQGDEGTVAVVEKSRMRRWLAQCEALAIRIDTLVPDACVLPKHKDGWSALQHDDMWLFRQPTGHAMAAESSWCADLLTASMPLPAIYSYSPVPAEGALAQFDWQPQPETHLFTLAVTAALPASADLRQGDYAQENTWRNALLPWRGVGIALAGYLLLVAVEAGWSHYQLYQQAEHWRQESVRVYRQIFPSETNVVNPRVQMQQHLQRASAGNGTKGLLARLTPLQKLIAQNGGVKIQSLSYEGSSGEFRLALLAGSYQALEQFQQQAMTDYQVQAGEMRQEHDRVEGRLTLRSQP